MSVVSTSTTKPVPIERLPKCAPVFAMRVRVSVNQADHDGYCSGNECEDEIDGFETTITMPEPLRVLVSMVGDTAEAAPLLLSAEIRKFDFLSADAATRAEIDRAASRWFDSLGTRSRQSGYCSAAASGRRHDFDIVDVRPVCIVEVAFVCGGNIASSSSMKNGCGSKQ